MTDLKDLPFAALDPGVDPSRPPIPIKRGMPCPQCGVGKLDYNGVLNLACPVCEYVLNEGAGCT